MYKFVLVFPHDANPEFFFIRDDLVDLMPKNCQIFRDDFRMFQLPIEAIRVSPAVGIAQLGAIARGGCFTPHDENIMGLLQEQPRLYYFLSRCKYARAMIIRKIKGK